MLTKNHNVEPLATSKVAEILGVSVSTTIRLVNTGKLTPLAKLPGKRGGYLFNRTEVEALAAELDKSEAAST